ncbi:MAG: AgmX/PglI C-terminal domain-containing protein [Deltaproteobacteria bacterium]|nr:MAG: AgmX/PglI C-terminal domain-containing protein [Deltaproteobacteria bacterium]
MIPIVLKVYDGGKLKSSRAFRAERIRLGSASADLVLESPGIAPTHAVIETGAMGAVLRATTAAPLYLNGQPILAAPLRHGDLISIGELRIMVELQARTLQTLGPQKSRPRLQLIHGEEEPLVDRPHQPAPTLQVVREEILVEVEAATDEGLNDDLNPVPFEPLPVEPAPEAAPAAAPAVPPASESAAVAVRAEPGAPVPTTALPPITTSLGGECAEVELFWGDTRVSVWQLQPGEQFHAGSAPGCQALLQGIERAAVVRSDVNGWTVAAPRPLQLFLEEEGRVLGGPELLVRGRSQADAHGLIVPLPQRSVAVLSSGSLALRIRRVRGAARVGGEQTDWKGVLVASIAAILMVTGMKFWSAAVPPPKVSAGDPELIKPRPLVVRASPPKPDNAPVLDAQKVQNQARRDPGKAVARHQGQEGEAGGKTAPRRDARAQRKMDDRALIAEIGLLKALGGGNGKSDVFGVALEKGTRDAMGHLTGPRIGDAHGDGGTGLKSLGGRGGGGDGSGLGLARIGTNGIGGGLANYGDGKGGLRGKENGEIGLGPGKPEVVGSIDPELIRKVVHDHRAQIRTCYETQLTTRPNLAGKLVSAWTIDPAGAVTEARTQESTLRDRAVETCVAARIKTWRFPIPKGGGEVFVTYPFIFTPGG